MSIGGKRDKNNIVEGAPEDNAWSQDPHNPQDPLNGITENEPVIVQVRERRSVVDSEYIPLTHLILHTSGDMWRVDYYRQLVGLNDHLRPLQEGTANTSQQYERINNFELKVDDALSPTQDSKSKEFKVTGSGLVTHGLIPNYGDMFVADIGNGKAGLLTVTSSEQAGYTAESVYKIEWEVVDTLEQKWIDMLDARAVRTLIYVRELAELYDTPFMTEAAYFTYVDLEKQDDRLIEFFKQAFWAKQVRSITLPGQDDYIYDDFHSRFCRDVDLTDIRNPIETYALGSVDTNDVVTIWDLFEEMDTYKFSMLHRDMCINHVKTMPGIHVSRTVSWSPYDQAVLPLGKIETIDGEFSFSDSSTTLTSKPNGKGAVTLPETLRARFNIANKPLYGLVSFKPYVLSTAFYDRDVENMSVLEEMLYRSINGDVVPPEIVAVLSKELYTEPDLSIYYYTPLLLVLIFYCKRGGV